MLLIFLCGTECRLFLSWTFSSVWLPRFEAEGRSLFGEGGEMRWRTSGRNRWKGISAAGLQPIRSHVNTSGQWPWARGAFNFASREPDGVPVSESPEEPSSFRAEHGGRAGGGRWSGADERGAGPEKRGRVLTGPPEDVRARSGAEIHRHRQVSTGVLPPRGGGGRGGDKKSVRNNSAVYKKRNQKKNKAVCNIQLRKTTERFYNRFITGL